MKIRFYEAWIMTIGKFFNKIGDAIQWIGVFLYFKRQGITSVFPFFKIKGTANDIDEQLPPAAWPKHEP